MLDSGFDQTGKAVVIGPGRKDLEVNSLPPRTQQLLGRLEPEGVDNDPESRQVLPSAREVDVVTREER
ncbi:hypothetical protein GCM10011499_19840 [Pelagibacterium lentulum]|uniref:Uncharacterized protein n=1 Tax=Pelagibacterium lentulum TaxID=2029865 RepID=A0A916RBC2_9HYPH|nr:hypothetical protein GCM10011499_19840 [Pelagibacterium lentulum]